jgi:hypothetical protein
MEIVMKSVEVNQELVSNDNTPIQYLSEYPGINFQTPFFGAELTIQRSSIGIQSTNPNDSLVAYTNFYFEDKYIGSSSLEKSFLGQEFTIKVGDETYKGVFQDEKTNLQK